MMELGACEPVRRVPGYDRVQQEQTKVARFAKVTGGRDCKTFSLALTCMSFCANLPACFGYAVCLFLVAFVSSSCTMVKVEHRVAVKPAAFS